MQLNFKDKKVIRIAFLGQPESELIPANEIVEKQFYLVDFSWDIDQKPDKKSMLGWK